MKTLFLLCILTISTFVTQAQTKPPAITDTSDLSNLSIEALMQLKSRYRATDLEKNITQAIEIASRKPLSLRRSPSIVTVITEEDIEHSGAKDFSEILKMIPGMELNMDVEGVTALSFRGLRANEGKVMLLIDGLEMNEIAYATLQFGNHYPINNIKKIEIIRGPGSAIYGGSSEYASINIITKKTQGVGVHGLAGQTNNGYSTQNIGLTLGNKSKNLDYTITSLIGRANRSNRDYTDIYGTTYNMTGNSAMNPHFVNAHIGYKNFSLNYIYDHYKTTTRDGYVEALSRPYACNFLSSIVELQYKKAFKNHKSFEAKAYYKYCNPWAFDGYSEPQDSSYNFYVIKAYRLGANSTFNWDPMQWLSMNVGLSYTMDEGRKPEQSIFQRDQVNTVQYVNYAAYAQMYFKLRYANITLGARQDVSTAFGQSFNPRLGITKKVGVANFKLLYASSFRAPAIENIQYSLSNKTLEAEQSKTIELETSVKLGKRMYLSVNLFDISTNNAITYYVRPDTSGLGDPDGYRNAPNKIGSQGLEAEYKYKSSKLSLGMMYSYYTLKNKLVDSTNFVLGQPQLSLGNAQHKLALYASYKVSDKFFISPSIHYLSKRYGYTSMDAMNKPILQTIDPQCILSIYFGSNQLVKNCNLGLGINNIADNKVWYIQTYNSLHAPLPGMGRDIYLKLNYNIHFKSDHQPS